MTTTHTLADPPLRLIRALTRATATVATRATDRLAAAHDASHYQLTPQAVVTVASVDEIVELFAVARREGTSLTFRSGGTSLSGQAGTDAILVDTRRNFRAIQVLDNGERVRVEPGATVRAVNLRLARDGRKLGPDPASEIACTIGGVVANNSSGMVCGVEANTYRTLDSAILVLPSGTVVDTGANDADAALRRDEPGLHAGLLHLRDRIRGNPDSVDALRKLHAIKNTVGYGLNSFLDHDDAVDILEHLIVGSEGTLAFVAEATFRTVTVRSFAATGLLVFDHLTAATRALPELGAAGFAAIELLDAASLRVAQRDAAATDELRALTVRDHAALLVEFQEATPDALENRLGEAAGLLSRLPLSAPYHLSDEAVRRSQLWHLRKGLFAAIAGERPPGTTALLEDIAVPVENLDATCRSLVALFAKHGYVDGVIFGHAKDGNIHFLINERFDDPGLLARYEAFTEDLVDLVLGQNGTLKAEHGTGRIMAPFVRRQYGDELYDVMKAVKALVDPLGVLNPGVLLSDDPEAHLRDLKPAVTVEAEVDRCVECGYCEPVCPSKDITLTPRDRIVLRREMRLADQRGDHRLLRTLQREYRYDGVQTCAVDGMCQTACPVLINTGDLVRRLRAENAGSVEQAAWKAAAQRWDATTRAGGMGLSAAAAIPAPVPVAATRAARILLDRDKMPEYHADLPPGGTRRTAIADVNAVAVYFPSCTTTMFGADQGDGVGESFLRLCERAGVAVATPDDIAALCCGTPWKSKGLLAGYEEMKNRASASLREATKNGSLPVICDAASCTEGLAGLIEAAGLEGIQVIDAIQFVNDVVLPRLPEPHRLASVSVHPTCSTTRLGIDPALMRVASAVAQEVRVADDWSCCAFAGDRGLLHPELTASATRAQAADVRAHPTNAHASANRMCEIGMTRATGVPYQHVLQLLDATTTKETP
jgi:D-lactate dehydrogenase